MTDNNERMIALETREIMIQLLESRAWQVLFPLINEKISLVKAKREHSDDPGVVMSCVRQEDGLMYIKELIDELIVVGDKAAIDAE